MTITFHASSCATLALTDRPERTEMNNYDYDTPDPSDTFDACAFDEWEVPNIDYTANIPPIAGTVPAPPSEASRAFDAMFGGPVEMLAGLSVRPGSGA